MASILGCADEIVENIFSYLSLKELFKINLVCKKWKNISEDIRKKHTQVQLKIYQSTSTSFSEEKLFKNCVEAGSLPELIITVINYELRDRYLQHVNKNTAEEIHEELGDCLPPNCPNLLLSCSLCVSDQLKCFNYCYFVKPNPPLDHVYLTLTIPKIPKVKFDLFDIKSKNLKTKFENITNIKSILLFCNSEESVLLIQPYIVKYCMTVENFAFGVYSCMDHGTPSDKGIIISGENVHVAEIILPEIVTSKQDINRHIMSLEHPSYPCTARNSFCFMFPENKRQNVYDNDITTFQNNFPDIQLLGIKVSDIYKFDIIDQKIVSAILPSDFYKPSDWPQDEPFCFKRSNGPSQIVLISWKCP